MSKPSTQATISAEINGERMERVVEARRLLVHFLRDDLGLTGTHIGCDTGNCGACTVDLDGLTVKSCTVLAVQIDGSSVTTVEGLDGKAGVESLRNQFNQFHAIQCGYCTPGVLISAQALLRENHSPTEEEVRRAIQGNICRCTGYVNIVEAILAAARAEFS